MASQKAKGPVAVQANEAPRHDLGQIAADATRNDIIAQARQLDIVGVHIVEVQR